MMSKEDLWKRLDRDGEKIVRTKLAQGVYRRSGEPVVKEWLSRLERLRDSESANRRKTYDKIAAIAAIIAAVAATVSAIASIIGLF